MIFPKAIMLIIMFNIFLLANGYKYSIRVDDIYQINSKSIEFDVVLESEAGIQLNAYQCLLIIDLKLNIYENLKLDYIEGSSESNIPPFKCVSYKRINDCIIGFSSSAGNESIVQKKRIGRFKLTSSKGFLFEDLKLRWFFEGEYESILLGANYNNITEIENFTIENENYSLSNAISLFILHPGWNAISIPRKVSSGDFKSISENISKGPFLISGNQSQVDIQDTFMAGYAYWLFADEKKIIDLNGEPVKEFSVEIDKSGNSCIGALAIEKEKNNIQSTPTNIIQGQMFYWDNVDKQYKMGSKLIPGAAHFINVNQKGTLSLQE